MTTKHTPGPWMVEFNGLSGYGDNGNTFNILTASGSGKIAALPSSFRLLDRHSQTDEDFLQEKANANLIAAAPDLLDVARMVDAWGNGLRHLTKHENKMVKAARAALTQAQP